MVRHILLPNQLRAYVIRVRDNPFDMSRMFAIPFDTTGTVEHSPNHVCRLSGRRNPRRQVRIPNHLCRLSSRRRLRGQLCISYHMCQLSGGWEKMHLPYHTTYEQGLESISRSIAWLTGTKAAKSRKCGRYIPLHLG
jgi:hypothetical protein